MSDMRSSPPPMLHLRRTLFVVMAAAVMSVACTNGTGTAGTAGGADIATLHTLAVEPASDAATYDRDRFGPEWADVDHNGCDTRNDVLRRDLHDVVTRDGTNGCVVVEGVLDDPYTGRRITFTKSDAGRVEIDHVVSLAAAWRSGAAQWDDDTRTRFANDPANLQATRRETNQTKSDLDATGWIPPNNAYRCRFAARQVQVKAAWQLRVTAHERDTLAQLLAACPQDQQHSPATVPPVSARTPVTEPWSSCAQARAAGQVPLRRGEAGYNSRLDGDGDGLACE